MRLIKTIDMANEVWGLLKILGLRLTRSFGQRRCDGVMRPMVEIDDVLAQALLPLLDVWPNLYKDFLEFARLV